MAITAAGQGARGAQVNLASPVGTDLKRQGGAVEGNTRHIQRRGQMAETGIHRHTGASAGDHRRHATQIQFGQHAGVLQTSDDALGSGLFKLAAPRQAHGQATAVEVFGQGAPISLWPVLAGPGGAMQEQHIRLGRRLTRHGATVQAIVTDRLRQRITQCLGEQLAHPLHRMLAPGDRIRAVITAAGQRLARRGAIQPGHGRINVACQQRAFQQALGIDHQVVAAFTQTLFERRPLTALPGLQQVLAPTAQRHGNHPRHGRMPGRNLGKALFHHPVELNAGDRPRSIGQGRQGMDHIAEGRGFDQQYPQTIRPRPDRRPGDPAPRSPDAASARAGSCSGRSGRCARSRGCTPGRDERSPPARPAAG